MPLVGGRAKEGGGEGHHKAPRFDGWLGSGAVR